MEKYQCIASSKGTVVPLCVCAHARMHVQNTPWCKCIFLCHMKPVESPGVFTGAGLLGYRAPLHVQLCQILPNCSPKRLDKLTRPFQTMFYLIRLGFGHLVSVNALILIRTPPFAYWTFWFLRPWLACSSPLLSLLLGVSFLLVIF